VDVDDADVLNRRVRQRDVGADQQRGTEGELEREVVEDGRRLQHPHDIGVVDEAVADGERRLVRDPRAGIRRTERGDEVVEVGLDVQLLHRPEVDVGLLEHGEHILGLEYVVRRSRTGVPEVLDVPRRHVERGGGADCGHVLCGGRPEGEEERKE
jgi:hypothetical protein